MNFCSDCGAAVSQRWIAEDRRERFICSSCGKVHFENPRILVVCLAFWQQELLMCKRAIDPARGKWNAPSGYLESGETLQEGAARETLEETGLVVDPRSLELYSVINLVGIEQVAVVFRTELHAKPELRPGCECLDARFFCEEEVRTMDVAWGDKMGDSRRLFFEQLRARQFGIQLVNTALRPGEVYDARVYELRSRGAK
jgi:ADP-ribose pyrophosphatase YjhB (NUDIX family)